MSLFYLNQFEEKFCELIMDLSKKYKDKIEIEIYKRSLNKLDYTKIANHFATKLQPYSKLVAATDDALFNIENLEFIDQINFNDIWKDNLSDTDKKSLWQYIQVLYLLSNIIIDENVNVSENNSDNIDNIDSTNNTDQLVNDDNPTDTNGSTQTCDITDADTDVVCTETKPEYAIDVNATTSDKVSPDTTNTIHRMIKTMKDNIENTNMDELSLDNISKKQIDEATSEVQSKFISTGSNNVMEDMISEINKELTNMVDNKDDDKTDTNDAENMFQSNPQLDMMSQMLNIDKNGLGGIMNIANKVSQKFQSRVENGDLDPAQLMSSAQSMLMGMQNMK